MELKKQLEEEFEKTKKELVLKTELDELDKIFYIRDNIEQVGFISNNFSRQLCGRMCDTFNSWVNYFHGIIMPNPHNMISNTESQLFSEEEKQEIIKVMNKILSHTSQNVLAGLKKDKHKEAEFIDNSLELWNSTVQPKLVFIMERVNNYWKEKSRD
ncbi:MAG: hypothetical protein ACOCZQ_00280 [Nanoarchaeota archaeon]